MGSDVVSACVFCGGLLLGSDLPPLPGPSAEVGAVYATLQRRYDLDQSRNDLSNVTPKFALLGLRGTTPAPEGWGAGTPEREWRARLALAPSHDDQEQRPVGVIGRDTANGTGRYENFAILYRLPISFRGSLEAGWVRRTHKSTDLVNLGGENYIVSEQRILAAERSDLGLGWRHRLRGLELAVSLRYTRPDAKNATAGSSHATNGTMLGGGLEARLRRDRWVFSFAGEALRGNLSVHEESTPAFESRDFSSSASFDSFSASIARSWASTGVFLSATYDRSKLPFVALAVLGTETAAFDGGFHPESSTRATLWDLSLRQSISPGVEVRLWARAISGKETVTLTDSLGSRPPRRLVVDWLGAGGKGSGGSLGFLGSPAFSLGIGLEFSIGRARS